MEVRTQDFKCGLDKCESAFFDDMPMMIVTSSPIEGKQCENPNPITHRFSPPEVNPTWSELLRKFQTVSMRDEKYEKKKHITVEESVTTETDYTSSSYEPIAEHKMKILVNPSKKIQVLSSSSRKINFRNPTPKKTASYSVLSQQYHHKCESEDDEGEGSIQTIRKKIQNTEDLSMRDINRYEKIVRKVINQNKMKKEACSRTLVESDLMLLVEDQIGLCNLSPTTVRMLEKQSQDQEKRLISLSVAKRKSAAEIRKKIYGQLIETKQQIKNREELEVKQVKAAHLRHEATVTSTLFNRAHAAHHRQFVTESRQRDKLSQLKKQMHNEQIKNGTQISNVKVVRDVWKTLLQEQYNELRKDVREQNLQKVALLKESEEQLGRLKKSYDKKLRELKDMAATKGAEAGMEKKEIGREIERIQRKMQHQFQEEFQTLLRNVETKGDHKRFIRKEKAIQLHKKLQKADYVFDV